MAYIGNTPAEAYTSFDKQTITGDGGASYTLDHAVANEQEIEVFVNNVRQEPSVAYTVSGTALTMTGNVAASDDFYVVFQGKAIQTTSHPEGQDLQAREGTFTGDLTVDTDTLYVDSTNDRIGVRTTSPSKAFVISNDGAAGLEIDPFNRSAGTGTSLLSYNRSGSAYVRADYDASEHLMMVSGSEKARFTTNGLTFNGDTAAANALDDYEEGTWTPAFGVSTGTNATYTYGSQTGNYVKIGNTVFVNGHVATTARSGGSTGSALTVTGLPFTNSSGWKAGTVGYSHGFSVLANMGLVETGNTRMRFYSSYGSTHTSITLSHVPTSGNTNLYFAFYYHVA